MDGSVQARSAIEVTNQQLPITGEIFEVDMFHFCY
jgi:hypothetical protein